MKLIPSTLNFITNWDLLHLPAALAAVAGSLVTSSEGSAPLEDLENAGVQHEKGLVNTVDGQNPA